MGRDIDFIASRWRNLMHAIRVCYPQATEKEVQQLLYSSWLHEATTPRVAELTRRALSTNKSLKLVGVDAGVSSNYVSGCVSRSTAALRKLYRDVAGGKITVDGADMCQIISLDEPIHFAVLAGVCKSEDIRWIQESHYMTFNQMHEACSECGGIPHPLRPKYTCAECQRLCDVCREVHRMNNEPCAMRLSLASERRDC